MFVVETLKDYIRDADFVALADKALTFILNGSDIPKMPRREETMADLMRPFVPMLFTGGQPHEENRLSSAFYKYRFREVSDPKDSGRVGVIAGYSHELDSLLVSCYKDSDRGFDKGDGDVVELPPSFSSNGFFYVSVEEAKRQLD